MSALGRALARLSTWVDEHNHNAHRDPEAVLFSRVSKIAEEYGEVVTALIGMTGQNPRKGVTHARGDVVKELLDVAVAALATVEHLVGNDGSSVDLLEDHVRQVVQRAGVEVTHRCPRRGELTMPCCDIPPSERRGDRITLDDALVTCRGRAR